MQRHRGKAFTAPPSAAAAVPRAAVLLRRNTESGRRTARADGVLGLEHARSSRAASWHTLTGGLRSAMLDALLWRAESVTAPASSL
jgi:hypothetical protein